MLFFIILGGCAISIIIYLFVELITWLTYRSPRADLKRYDDTHEIHRLTEQIKTAPIIQPQALRVVQPGAIDRLHLRDTLDKFITEEANARIEQRIRMARYFKDSVKPPRSFLQVKANELAAIMESTKTKRKKGKNGKRKKA
jgi:hypothetical protein